jgi:hypothetical protein
MVSTSMLQGDDFLYRTVTVMFREGRWFVAAARRWKENDRVTERLLAPEPA